LSAWRIAGHLPLFLQVPAVAQGDQHDDFVDELSHVSSPSPLGGGHRHRNPRAG
jgi:hypothetical protein